MIVNLLSQRSGLAAHLAVVAPMAGVAGSMPEFVSGQMRARTTLQDVVSRMPALVHFTRAGMRNSYESRDVPAMLKHIDEARSHFNEFIVAPVNNNGLHQVSWQVALLRDFYMRVGTALRNFVSSSVLGDPVLHDAEWAVFRHVCKDCGRLLNRLERVLRQPISNSTQHLVDFYAALETVEDAVSNSWRDDVTSYISDRFVDVFKQLREQNRRPDLKTVLRQLSKRKPRFSALSEMTPLAARKQIAEAYGAAKTVALSWTTLMAHLETTLHMTPSRGRLVSTKTAKSRAGQTVQDTTTRKLQSAAEALPPSRRTQLKREKSSELTRQNARSTSLPSQPEPLPQVSQDELRVEDAAVPAVDEFFEPPVKSKTRQTSRMSQAASARVPVQPDVPPPALPPSQRTKRHPERASQDAEPDVRSRSTSLPNQPEPPCKPEPASQSEPVNELGSLSALVVEDPGEQFLEPSARRSETTPVVSKPPPAQLQPPTEQDDPASQASDAANSPAVRPNEVRLASPRPAQSEFSAQTGRIPSKGASVAHLAVVQRGQSKSDESESDQISSKPTKSDMSDQLWRNIVSLEDLQRVTDHIDVGIFTATSPSCEVTRHVQSEIPLLRQRIQDLTLDPSLTLNDFDVIELSLESSEMLEWATEAHIVDIPSFLWTYQGKTFIVEHHDIDRVAVEVISSQTVAQHVDKSLDLTQFKVPAVEFRITSEQAAQLAGELLKDRLWLLAFFVSGNESDTLRMVQQGPFGPIERRVDYFTQIDSKALSTLIDRWRFPVVLQAHAEHLRLAEQQGLPIVAFETASRAVIDLCLARDWACVQLSGVEGAHFKDYYGFRYLEDSGDIFVVLAGSRRGWRLVVSEHLERDIDARLRLEMPYSLRDTPGLLGLGHSMALSGSTFTQTVSRVETLLLFYSPACAHSAKMLELLWPDVSYRLRQTRTLVAHASADGNDYVLPVGTVRAHTSSGDARFPPVEMLDLDSLAAPTILLITAGTPRVVLEYAGELSADAVVMFVVVHSQ